MPPRAVAGNTHEPSCSLPHHGYQKLTCARPIPPILPAPLALPAPYLWSHLSLRISHCMPFGRVAARIKAEMSWMTYKANFGEVVWLVGFQPMRR